MSKPRVRMRWFQGRGWRFAQVHSDGWVPSTELAWSDSVKGALIIAPALRGPLGMGVR
jgi:hypothetical protein